MEDIQGRCALVGDTVVFSYTVWDRVTRLQIADVVAVGDGNIEVSFIDKSFMYSKETRSHSIEVNKIVTKTITEFVKL